MSQAEDGQLSQAYRMVTVLFERVSVRGALTSLTQCSIPSHYKVKSLMNAMLAEPEMRIAWNATRKMSRWNLDQPNSMDGVGDDMSQVVSDLLPTKCWEGRLPFEGASSCFIFL